jgi:hypothetical protein
MIFVDAHVHIYGCFDVNFLLDSAWSNFEEAAGQVGSSAKNVSYVLLLTEGATDSWFQQQTVKQSFNDKGEIQVSADWNGVFSRVADALIVYRRDCPERKLYIAAGYQVVTAEKIEVLALFCVDRMKSGLLLERTVTGIQQTGGVPVLPWGAGKWLGERGSLVRNLFMKPEMNPVFPGDNGGRPGLWPAPGLFAAVQKKNTPLLSGTDPLPLPDEAARVGSFGFYLREEPLQDCDEFPGRLKKAMLSPNTKKYSFGVLQKNGRFFVNQLRLRSAS